MKKTPSHIGELWNELITLTGISKTDFAIALNISPSSLSKILSGSRSIPLGDIEYFAKSSAWFFSKTLFRKDTHTILADVFPALYAFEAKTELAAFLETAVEYACIKDASRNNGLLKRCSGRTSYIGTEECLNAFCTIISDAIRSVSSAPLEIFSSYPFHKKGYKDLFARTLHSSVLNPYSVSSFNYYMDMRNFAREVEEQGLSALSLFENGIDSYELNVFKIDLEKGPYFYYVKDEFLMLFSIHIDGTLMMTKIDQKTLLARFEKTLLGSFSEKISYSSNEFAALLLENQNILDGIIGDDARSYVSSYFMGYLLEPEDLSSDLRARQEGKLAVQLMSGLRSNKAAVVALAASVKDFLVTGDVYVPLCGKISIDPDHRLTFLARFGDCMESSKDINKYWAYTKDLPRATVFSSSTRSVVYTYNETLNTEKYILLETPTISDYADAMLQNDGIPATSITIAYWKQFFADSGTAHAPLSREGKR